MQPVVTRATHDELARQVQYLEVENQKHWSLTNLRETLIRIGANVGGMPGTGNIGWERAAIVFLCSLRSW